MENDNKNIKLNWIIFLIFAQILVTLYGINYLAHKDENKVKSDCASFATGAKNSKGEIDEDSFIAIYKECLKVDNASWIWEKMASISGDLEGISDDIGTINDKLK